MRVHVRRRPSITSVLVQLFIGWPLLILSLVGILIAIGTEAIPQQVGWPIYGVLGCAFITAIALVARSDT